jgi:hypothetical protein
MFKPFRLILAALMLAMWPSPNDRPASVEQPQE